MKSISLFLLILLSFTHAALPQSCPLGLSGTFSIGPAGNYSTLGAALADLHIKGLSGPVILELQNGYTPTSETFPLSFNAVGCSAKGKEVTIRPAAGTTGLSIIANNSVAALDFNNGSHFILDGRPGGTDTAHLLLISNTNTDGSAIRFINGADYNELNHLDIQSVTNNSSGGIIFFAGSDSTLGNSYNHIDTCNLSAGATSPIFGIYAFGNSTGSNKGNTINSCNIFNFGGSDLYTGYGIYFGLGYDSVVVTNNSIYQTADRNTPADLNLSPQNVTGISVGTGYDGGHIITGNFVGGTAPGAGGVAMSLPLCIQFNGISVSSMTGPGMASQVNNNTISNITWPDTYGNIQLIQLGINGDPFNGSCTNNILGNANGSATINITNSQYNLNKTIQFAGIQCSSNAIPDPIIISNNHISGIWADAKTNGQFFGIFVTTNGYYHGSYILQGNQVGEDAYHYNNWWKGSGAMYGILVEGSDMGTDSVIINHNHVANMNCGTDGYQNDNGVVGIQYNGIIMGPHYIDSNTVHDLYAITEEESDYGMMGISVYDNDLESISSGTFNCRNNTIYSVGFGSGNGAAMPYQVAGISIQSWGTTSDLHYTISRNQIEGLYLSDTAYMSDDAIQSICGICLLAANAGTSLVDNNMIQIGIAPSGQPMTQGYTYVGLSDQAGSNQYLHNTVYLHMDSKSFVEACYAFSGGQQSTSATTLVMNNIFAGTRSVSGDGYSLINLFSQQPGFQSDYNLFSITGMNGQGGYIGNKDSTLAQWQAATGYDQHSQLADPLLIHPEGGYPEVNLHLNNGTPAESTGTPTYTTLIDIDGKLRAEYTPVDIGADAGNFKGVPQDTTSKDTTGNPGSTPSDSTLVRTYPNPFSSNLTLVIPAQQAGTATIALYSFSGTLITVLTPSVIQGDNTVTISMSNYPDGTYIVRVQVGSKQQTLEVVKKSG